MSVTPIQAAPLSAPASPAPTSFWALTLGSVGVVYGDIGTSPLYALKESLAAATAHAGSAALTREMVVGVVSLILWALILIVTIKYVVIVLRADNDGEGGTLSLVTLARRAVAMAAGPRSFSALLARLSSTVTWSSPLRSRSCPRWRA